MKTRIIEILTILFLTTTLGFGQNYEPLDLAKKIFSKDRFINIDKYVTGEYDGKPNGQDLHKSFSVKFALLEQTEKEAVVAMTIFESSGKGVDTYLHFEKDTVWKMCAFRALAMMGIIEQVKVKLEKMTLKKVDKIIAKSSNNKKNNFSMFTSREDYYFQLGNAKLTLDLDDNIIKHFLDNQAEFERLKDFALIQLEKEKADDERSIKLIENLKTDYQRLFISSVSTGGYELGNCLNFFIGGMIDNTVGYIYVKNKNDLPEMNPNRLIMIKEIGSGWYIYKTT